MDGHPQDTWSYCQLWITSSGWDILCWPGIAITMKKATKNTLNREPCPFCQTQGRWNLGRRWAAALLYLPFLEIQFSQFLSRTAIETHRNAPINGSRAPRWDLDIGVLDQWWTVQDQVGLIIPSALGYHSHDYMCIYIYIYDILIYMNICTYVCIYIYTLPTATSWDIRWVQVLFSPESAAARVVFFGSVSKVEVHPLTPCRAQWPLDRCHLRAGGVPIVDNCQCGYGWNLETQMIEAAKFVGHTNTRIQNWWLRPLFSIL